jgi:two-component system response regulator HydG
MIAECESQKVFGAFVLGHSEGMTRVWDSLRVLAGSRCNPILILGETGTGKEVAAKVVHHWRGLDEQPFVAVNCASLSAGLLESELFGHVRGAFTGADREKAGLFEMAGEGSIYLDEISEMPLDLQAKLLRVLQDGRFRRVGGTTDISCKATVIASSNRPLAQEAAAGRFRRDLYYRLAVFPVTIPPLQSPSRRGDIPLLAEHFLHNSTITDSHNIRGFTHEAMVAMVNHSWPGNVRELRNVVDRAILLEKGDFIAAANIRLDSTEAELAAGDQAAQAPADCAEAVEANPEEEFSLEAAERIFILRALKKTGGHRAKAAMLLGITRATLHTKLKTYGMASTSLHLAPDSCSVGLDDRSEVYSRAG